MTKTVDTDESSLMLLVDAQLCQTNQDFTKLAKEHKVSLHVEKYPRSTELKDLFHIDGSLPNIGSFVEKFLQTFLVKYIGERKFSPCDPQVNKENSLKKTFTLIQDILEASLLARLSQDFQKVEQARKCQIRINSQSIGDIHISVTAESDQIKGIIIDFLSTINKIKTQDQPPLKVSDDTLTQDNLKSQMILASNTPSIQHSYINSYPGISNSTLQLDPNYPAQATECRSPNTLDLLGSNNNNNNIQTPKQHDNLMKNQHCPQQQTIENLNMSFINMNNRPISKESLINCQSLMPTVSSHLGQNILDQSHAQNILINSSGQLQIASPSSIHSPLGTTLPGHQAANLFQSNSSQIFQNLQNTDWMSNPLLSSASPSQLIGQHRFDPLKNNFLSLPIDPALQLTPLILLPNKSNMNSKDLSKAIYSRDIIISNDLIGCIIGKGGCTINGIRKLSTASIKIGNLEEGSKDRRITVTGTLESVTSTIMTINSILETHKQIWQLNIQLASTMTAAISSQDSNNMNMALAQAAYVQDTRNGLMCMNQMPQFAQNLPFAGFPTSQLTNPSQQIHSSPFSQSSLIVPSVNQIPNSSSTTNFNNLLTNQSNIQPSTEQMYKIKTQKVNCVKYEPY